jgi:hypothetical protein
MVVSRWQAAKLVVEAKALAQGDSDLRGIVNALLRPRIGTFKANPAQIVGNDGSRKRFRGTSDWRRGWDSNKPTMRLHAQDFRAHYRVLPPELAPCGGKSRDEATDLTLRND